MTTRSTRNALVPLAAAMIVGLATALPLTVQHVAGSELDNCSIIIRPRPQSGVPESSLQFAEISTPTEGGMELEMNVPMGVLLHLDNGVANGDNSVTMGSASNSTTYTVKFLLNTQEDGFDVTVHEGTNQLTSWSASANGTYDPYGVVHYPWIVDFGSSDSGHNRVRVWIHYYGLEAPFALIDRVGP